MLITSFPLKRFVLAVGSVLAIALAVPAQARAQVCVSNTDCAKGTSCQVSGVAPGRPAPCAKTDPASACESGSPADLVVIEMSCQLAACTVDADCGPDMVCHTETTTSCSGGTAKACPANTACDLPTPATCTDRTTSVCAYRWQLPCSADQECGAGFVCTPATTTSCSGSGGGVAGGGTTGTVPPTPASDGGAAGAGSTGSGPGAVPPDVAPTSRDGGAAVIPPGECTTTSSFPGFCQAKATTCSVDSDCPRAWSCVEVPAATTPPDRPTSSGPGIATDVATPMASPAPTSAPQHVCQSPSYAQPAGRGSFGATPTAGDKGAVSVGEGTAVPPASPGAGLDTAATTSSGNAGCAVGGAAQGTGGAGVVLAMSGLLLGFARGRRRRSVRCGR